MGANINFEPCIDPIEKIVNLENQNQPIILHELIIRRGIANNKRYGLQQQIERRFSKYGKI